ncbi:MAG: fused MFS/spermidine synthase [Acidobacteria bacterium]|nr:fused MFS/spermidine synthase [Acidobacteriota bacterium]
MIRAAYASAIFLASLLLFLVQPMMAKRLLPLFGGSAGVWTTCMFFFQFALLLGYAYAHWLGRRKFVHAGLVVASLFLLPLALKAPLPSTPPVLSILRILAATIGLPYLLLSATSPLMQSWFAAGPATYRLYAVSNASSLVALLAYPFVIEPWLPVSSQIRLWTYAYVVFAALTLLAAVHAAPQRVESGRGRILWIALSAGPAALWLAVANRISQTVAPVPLIWILPLSVYLLTLILCFQGAGYRPKIYRWLLVPAVVALVAGMNQHNWSQRLWWGLGLFLGGLFVCSMICHGELVQRKPGTGSLTSFYLSVAAGGVIGGAFVSLVSPLVFKSHFELPVAIVVCLLLALATMFHLAPRLMIRLALVALAALIVTGQIADRGLFQERNFYGVLEVRQGDSASGPYRTLANGAILHGAQFLSPEHSREATTYYAPASGVGAAFRELRGPLRIGGVGMGVGTIAAYARENDYLRFYEINPAVIRVAHSRFTYLWEAKGRIEIIEGDARLALQAEAPQNFDLLVVDAFSGDSVPVHLLSNEAFHLYFRHLNERGILAVHVTNKYVNLLPVLTRTALALGREMNIVKNSPELSRLVMASTWVLLKGKTQQRPAGRVWTDDYSNLLEALK